MSDETTSLLQALIRNAAVNHGTPDSGNEILNVRTLEAYFGEALESPRVTTDVVEPHPGRASLIVRVAGRDASARSILLLGHIDVVPVEKAGWMHGPFSGEIVDGEVWGRGAVDMLTLTAAMAVITKRAIESEQPPLGDLIFAAVADEEAGGDFGTGWIVEHHPELLRADDVLTEQGGVLLDPSRADSGITIGIGEKGRAPRRIHVTGVPAHAAVPWGSRSAAEAASEIVLALLRNPAPPMVLPYWPEFVSALHLDSDTAEALVDPERLDAVLPELGSLAGLGHALTHMTVSPNVVRAGEKLNVIPGEATVDLDIRVLPGQTEADVDAWLRQVLEPWQDVIRISGSEFTPGNTSPTGTELYNRILEVFARHYPDAIPAVGIGPGGSDGRFLRALGANVYGFGLISKRLPLVEFRNRLHAHNERIDLESIDLTTRALAEVVLGDAGHAR
ncbi:M20/M25/M40 family metallo-hydrolase [Gulosibacter chungangensis]|uniref:M20/M25/M40 family metallo-hydrolase n=1 Tax=Gulosibacter chungangensis TaxID=979746 RepID=A0A7J5BE56_9MICO|nr:M20/M25/M40 family metallo-hydrolase [Gulosibacter chungangensis]KAB1643924.1 M20/M25/M40 family metallo-hydrolase [Gulosibacter chungangensis]